jgi:hypothetical protein
MSNTDQLLMTAILSMDAYSQGYNRGVFLPQNKVDPKTGYGNIGDAVFVTHSETNPKLAGGFYAQSYLWDGKRVIAYRGTDNLSLDPFALDSQKSVSDVWSGWVVGAGQPTGQALQEAARER